MKVLIDSNIITYVLREREIVLARFAEALRADNVFVSSDVVDYEIRRYLVPGAQGCQETVGAV